MATTAINDSLRFPVRSWRPTAGRNMDFHKWVGGRNMLLAAFGLTPEQFESLDLRTPTLDLNNYRSKAAREQAQYELADHMLRLAHWQAVNTAVYWHLRPSVVVDGVDELRHMRQLDAMYSGHCADGQRLSEWVLGHVDMSDPDAQINLWKALAAASLKEGSDRSALSAHAQQMLQVWLLLKDSDPSQRSSLARLYDYLLHSMPTKPEGAHLTSLRTWFAGVISEFKAGGRCDFLDFDTGLDTMLKHAATLGVPQQLALMY